MELKLVEYTFLKKYSIKRNDEGRVLIINNSILKFSPTQYHLILLLLTGKVLKEDELIQEIFECESSPATIKNLGKHVEKLRCKLGIMNINICRVAKYGYVLVTEDT